MRQIAKICQKSADSSHSGALADHPNSLCVHDYVRGHLLLRGEWFSAGSVVYSGGGLSPRTWPGRNNGRWVVFVWDWVGGEGVSIVGDGDVHGKALNPAEIWGLHAFNVAP